MKKLNKKGVSLAELLAVVVIMGIIAAIAIPLVGNVIETSKKKAFLGDVTTIAEAARTYCLVEKKSDDTFCDELVRDTTSKVASEIKKGAFNFDDKGDFVPGTKAEGKLSDTKLTEPAEINGQLTKYVSKAMDKIGTDIYVIYDGSKYYVKATAASGSKFSTKGYIDPTNVDADIDDLVNTAE